MLRTTPHKYQQKNAKELAASYFGMLHMDPGTGKTLTALMALTFVESGFYTVVVLMPKSLQDNFNLEIAKHYGRTLHPIHNLTTQRDRVKSGYINIIPFSIIQQVGPTIETEIDVCIIDEAHIARNPRTKTFNNLQNVSMKAAYTWLLTGTPIVNKEKDLYTLYNLKPGYDCNILTAKKEHVLSLPKITYYTVPFTNEPILRYNSSFTLARITQERVQSSGNPEKWDYLKNLKDSLTPDGKKRNIIVFTNFKTAANVLMEFLETDLGINGDMTQKQRTAMISNFQTNGGTIVCTYDTAGVGINLCRADTVVCMEPPWNAAKLQQAIDRAYRIGLNHPLSVYLLQQTDEKWIFGMVGHKQAISIEILGDPKRLDLDDYMDSVRVEHLSSLDPDEED